MSVRKTTLIGDQVLRQKAKKVSLVASARIRKLVTDLADSMRSAELVGMAAPQIGVSLRVFVTEIRKTKQRTSVDETDPLRVFINPRVVSRSKKQVYGYEGCGSIAPTDGLFGNVPRAESLVVRAQNERGEYFTLAARGLLARVIQHEVDHLDGKVFLDRVTDTRSLRSRATHLQSQSRK